ncbi:MAG TPA: SpoIIIAC/SpoIIIAD family protein [Massilibacterium sp.]|nr:SpoIIIAC/SpoIIIAD family protein [Massilibacterium sp.]
MQLSGRLNIEEPYIVLMMKLIGVAYIAEISAQLMKDAGFQALSYKIEVSGKILIITMAMPIITALIETFVQMVQSFL